MAHAPTHLQLERADRSRLSRRHLARLAPETRSRPEVRQRDRSADVLLATRVRLALDRIAQANPEVALQRTHGVALAIDQGNKIRGPAPKRRDDKRTSG